MFLNLEKTILRLNTEISFFNIDTEEISYNLWTIIIGIIILIVILKLIKKNNYEKEFFPGDLYGKAPWIFYELALILGFRKLSLIKKPYNIIFQVLATKKFDLIDSESSDQNVNFTLIETNILENNECNIVVSDTYPILNYQVPQKFIGNKTYKFERQGDVGKRIFSKDFMDSIGKIIVECRKNKLKMNIFLTTNIQNTRYLVEEYLLVGGRDYINIEVFQQNMSSTNKEFLDKGYRYIKKGN